MKQLFILLILVVMRTTSHAQNWVDNEAYPFKSHFISLTTGNMHYVDEGEGDIILFVHGTPTWSFLYRDFIKKFSKTNRCIAIDHLGFGLSEKPADFDGTPESHSKNLIEFMETMNLENITLVVHDFGGPIGLSAALSAPDKISNIVMFNTWLWETASNPEVQKVDNILNGWMGKFMYLNMNVSPKILLKKAFNNKKILTKKIHKQYLHPFPDKQSRHSLLNIGKSLLGSSEWYEVQKKQLSRISNKPWLILWGTKDDFIKMDYLNKWKKLIPTAAVKELDSGHFVQEEKTTEAILAMSNFLE